MAEATESLYVSLYDDIFFVETVNLKTGRRTKVTAHSRQTLPELLDNIRACIEVGFSVDVSEAARPFVSLREVV